MEQPDLYVNLDLLPGTQIKIDQYHVFTVTCCSSPDSGRGIPMSLDYFLKLVFKISPYIISVTTYDPNVRDILLRYIPEEKIIYTGRGGEEGIEGGIGGGGGGGIDFGTGGGENGGESDDGGGFSGIGIR